MPSKGNPDAFVVIKLSSVSLLANLRFSGLKNNVGNPAPVRGAALS
jgi:hypothetical protein